MRRRIKIQFYLVALFFSTFQAFCQDGSLDTTFGTGGKVMTQVGSGDDYCNAMAIQPDGKIILAGYTINGTDYDYALARYNIDGTLDTGFGTLGRVISNFGSYGDVIYAIALQPDGKILVAGKTVNINSKFVVIRYLSDGSLDASFGNFGNTVTTIGTNSSFATSIVLQPDGKIILAGRSVVGSYYDFALARYTSDGSLDQSFGTAGVLTTAIGPQDDYGYAVALQDDGKIIVSGYAYNGTDADFAVVRYNDNGSLDTSFDTDGKLTTDFNATRDIIYSMAIQDDGKIVVAGTSGIFPSVDFAVVRYNPNGSLDTGFGTNGKVVTLFGPRDDLAFSIAIQNDNKILVAGYSALNASSNTDYAIARYNTDGTLDTSFDTDGKVLTHIGTLNNRIYSVALQSDGKIVAAGSSYNGADNDFSLARYHSALLGTIDFEAANQATVFPNPVSSDGTLFSNLCFEDVTVIIYNSIGQQLRNIKNFSGNSIPLNQADFKEGLYYIQFLTQNKVLRTNKFLVKN
jgi:uncharacterized delta-60 repeat protein